MQSTNLFKQPYYSSKEECLNHRYLKSEKGNKRYKYFSQTYFTAGDVDQFDTNIQVSNQHITNTFKYLYHKFKKGIYVRIENNKVAIFLYNLSDLTGSI